jgi:hypothetical protein
MSAPPNWMKNKKRHGNTWFVYDCCVSELCIKDDCCWTTLPLLLQHVLQVPRNRPAAHSHGATGGVRLLLAKVAAEGGTAYRAALNLAKAAAAYAKVAARQKGDLSWKMEQDRVREFYEAAAKHALLWDQ